MSLTSRVIIFKIKKTIGKEIRCNEIIIVLVYTYIYIINVTYVPKNKTNEY